MSDSRAVPVSAPTLRPDITREERASLSDIITRLERADTSELWFAIRDVLFIEVEKIVARRAPPAADAQRAALEWLVNLACGVGKAGGKPEEWEIEEAVAAGKAALLRRLAGGRARPKIVCLCGSTRFMDAFFEAGWRETLAGRIVLSVGVVKSSEADETGGHGAEALGPEVVARLDELHKRKIDLADEVLVLNVGGYIGESTRSEIVYAEAHGKPVRYLEPLAGGNR